MILKSSQGFFQRALKSSWGIFRRDVVNNPSEESLWRIVLKNHSEGFLPRTPESSQELLRALKNVLKWSLPTILWNDSLEELFRNDNGDRAVVNISQELLRIIRKRHLKWFFQMIRKSSQELLRALKSSWYCFFTRIKKQESINKNQEKESRNKNQGTRNKKQETRNKN